MIGALATWAHNRKIDPETEGETFIEIVRDVETTVIKVPAGIQDYYGAMFGGLQSLHWGFGSHRREWLPDPTLAELDQRLMLFYSGQSRNSGINNWVLFKGFIDNQEGVREKFEKIASATVGLDQALRAQNWQAAGVAIAEEWATRKTLAPGISTPEINAAFAEAARVAPISGKICGAGGGGCFFIYLPSADPSQRAEIISRLGQLPGIRPLPFTSSKRGVDVQVSRA
jgi:D-glycero-alpha-D-manno-heptose-7-phosphate kinase